MKAILVIDDMPKNCDECPIRLSGEPNEWCWLLKHGLDDIKTKPEWCPLKPMPQRQNTDEEKSSLEYIYEAENLDDFQTRGASYLYGHVDGWNACLDEITRE